ncbi:MAG: hypothetical protein GY870_11370 [archaeon]|nr:hypothetical protein [archaeon]
MGTTKSVDLSKGEKIVKTDTMDKTDTVDGMENSESKEIMEKTERLSDVVGTHKVLELPVIVLVGVNQDLIKVLGTLLSDKYHFVSISHDFNIMRLRSYEKVALFIVDINCSFMKIYNLLPKIKENQIYQNIPVLGLLLEGNFSKMSLEQRGLFEDIIPIPCSGEDLFTRIDVWVHTHNAIND